MHRALVVELGGTHLSLPAEVRTEVVKHGAATSLPQAAPLLHGLSVVHGRAVPVVNLSHLLGLPEQNGTISVLAETAGEQFLLPVDRVLGLLNLPAGRSSTDLLGQPVTVQDPESALQIKVHPINTSVMLSSILTHLERL